MNAYEQKRAARIDRMRERAEKLATSSRVALGRADAIASMIPMGQPVLVGHHSEGKHRRDLARIDAGMRKGVDLAKESAETARRAERAEASTVVSSDDPDAIAKLREQLDEAEAQHARLLTANAQIRTNIGTLADIDTFLGWPRGRVASWLSMGHKTIPTTNSSANVRRIKARIDELTRRADVAPAARVTVGDVSIVETDNRVRIAFPGKPDDATRETLKSHGFRWSPSAGAWQRHASPDAWYWARKIVGVAP